MHVLLVAPTLGANTIHVLHHLIALEGVRAGVITPTRADAIPRAIRERLIGHFQVGNTLDAGELLRAARAFQADHGRIDRLLGFVEHVQIPLGIVRDALGIPGVGERVARNFRDKQRMKEVLAAAGLPVARQRRVESAADAIAFAREVGGMVLKPLEGVGGVATVRVRSMDELHGVLGRLAPSPQRPFLAEEFVVGTERSFETVVVDGEPLWWSSTRYADRPLEVLEAPWKQWCVILPREEDEAVPARFLATNVAALRALGLQTGLAHMEWFQRPDGSPVIGEVGARPPGAGFMDMIGRVHGVDFWGRWVRLMVTGQFEPMPPRRFAGGFAFFRGQGQGERITSVTGLDEAQARVGELVVDRKLPLVGAKASSSYEGDGWAMVLHPSTAVVQEALRVLVSSVRVHLG